MPSPCAMEEMARVIPCQTNAPWPTTTVHPQPAGADGDPRGPNTWPLEGNATAINNAAADVTNDQHPIGQCDRWHRWHCKCLPMSQNV